MVKLINGRTPDEIKIGLRTCQSPAMILGGCGSCPYKGCDGDCDLGLENDALALIEHLETQQPKWISVEERLPEGECLAIGWQHEMLIGNVYRSGAGYACESDGEYLMDVTHWMPLFEPPESD